MAKRAPELPLEQVLYDSRAPEVRVGKESEYAFLVLEKHGQQEFLQVWTDEFEPQVAFLMEERWVPLGTVAFYSGNSKPEMRQLKWYDDLHKKDPKRYARLYRKVVARLQAAASRLTEELTKNHVIERIQ